MRYFARKALFLVLALTSVVVGGAYAGDTWLPFSNQELSIEHAPLYLWRWVDQYTLERGWLLGDKTLGMLIETVHSGPINWWSEVKFPITSTPDYSEITKIRSPINSREVMIQHIDGTGNTLFLQVPYVKYI